MANAFDDWRPITDTGWSVGEPEISTLDKLRVKLPGLQESEDGYSLLNEGNDRTIKSYVESMKMTRYGYLLIAPCGMGKSKFAPGLIASSLKKTNIVFLSERIKSVNSTFDWYKKFPLPNVGHYEMRAGGSTKIFKAKGKFSMKIMTTNAFVDAKKFTTSDDTVVILDEAHNLTSGTVRVMKSVKSENLVRMTATPIDEGYPLDLSTPLPSRILFSTWSQYEVLDHVNKYNKRSHLVICPTIAHVEDFHAFVKSKVSQKIVTATSFGIHTSKLSIDFQKLEDMCKQGALVIATDILQESVTLDIQSVWDFGSRCRPITDVARRLRSAPDEADWFPDELIVGITWPEVGQVCGRVGRIASDDLCEAHINLGNGIPRARATYCPESRDGITTSDHWVPTRRLLQFSVFKKEVARRICSDRVSSCDLKLHKCLEHLDVPKSLCDNFKEKQRIVAEMFNSIPSDDAEMETKQEVPEETSSNDSRDDSESLEVVIPEPDLGSFPKVHAKRKVNKPFVGSSKTIYSFTSEGRQPNVFKKVVKVDLTFGADSEIDPSLKAIHGHEASKLKNIQRRGYKSLKLAKKQGFCSLALYSARERRHLHGWKPNMKLSELYELAPFKEDARLFMTGKSFAHVVPKGEFWSIREQVSYLASKGVNPRVGADDPDYISRLLAELDEADEDDDCEMEEVDCTQEEEDESDCEMEEVDCGYSSEEIPQQLPYHILLYGCDVEDIEIVSDVEEEVFEGFDSNATSPDICDHEFGVTDTLGLPANFMTPEDQEIQNIMDEIDDVYIRAPGDCWKKFLFHIDYLSGCDVTVADFLQNIEKHAEETGTIGLGADFGQIPPLSFGDFVETHELVRVNFCVMPDGDLHIVEVGGVGLANSRSYPEFVSFLQTYKKSRRVSDKTGALTNAVRGIVSPVTQEGIDASLQGAILDEIGRMNQLCPFRIHDENVEYFNTLGIPHYRESPRTHSHPVHYAIRQNKLLNEIPSYVDCPATVVNMKPSHVKKLREKVRYPIEERYVLRAAKDIGRFGKAVVDSPFELKPIKTPILILDQMAHYCSSADILDLFRKSDALQVIIAGHEFPIPALFSSASPLPTLWQHRVENGILKYKCEFDESHIYEQPFDPSLLLAKSLRNDDSSIVLYCQVVHSHLNSHTQIISRIPISVDKYLPVQMHDFIELMPVHRNRYLCDLVPRTLFDKLMDYAQSMGGLKPTEMRAKLRLHLDPGKFWMDENTKEELITIVSTIVRRADGGRRSRDKYYDSFDGKIRYNTIDRFHKWVESKFSRKYIRRWQGLTAAEHPLKMIPLVTLTADKNSEGSITNFKWLVDDDHKLSFFETFKLLFKRYLDYEQYKFMENDRTWISDPGALGNKMKFLTINPHNLKRHSREELMIHWQSVLAEMYSVKKKDEKPKEPPVLVLNKHKRRKEEKRAKFVSDQKAMRKAQNEANDRSLHFPMNVVVDHEKVRMRALKRYRAAEFDDPLEYWDPHFTWVAHEKKKLNPEDVPLPLDYDDDYCGLTYEDEGIWYYESPDDDDHSDGSTDSRDDSVSVIQSDDVQVYESISVGAGEDPEELVRRAAEIDGVDSAVDEAERVLEYSFPVPGLAEEVFLDRVDEGYAERVERAEAVAANAKISYEPRFTALPPTVWWNERYPLSVDSRFNEIPYWPVVVQKLPYPKQDCLLVAVSSLLNALSLKISPSALWVLLCQHLPQDIPRTYEEYGLSTECLDFFCIHFKIHVELETIEGPLHYGVRSCPPYKLVLKNFHFYPFEGRVPLAITAEHGEDGFVPQVAQDLIKELKSNPMVEFKPFVPDTEAPDRYLFHLIAKRIGTFKDNPVNEDRLKSWDVQLKAAIRAEKANPKERFMAVVVGDPGCGKSMGLVNILKKHKYHVPGVFQVCLPLAAVRDDWSKKLDVRKKKGVGNRPTNSSMVCTFEYALAKTQAGYVLVLDEDKYPTGFIALMCYLKPMIKYVVFLGDPFQGKWHDPGGKADELNAMPGELERYLDYASWYIIGTNRFGTQMGNILCTPVRYDVPHNGIRFAAKVPTSVNDLVDIYPGVPRAQLKEWWNDHAYLEASGAAAEASNMLNNNDTMTMSGSQGLTKSLIVVHLNVTVVRLVGMDVLWVAMSRSQRVIVYISMINAGMNAGLINSKPAIRELYHYKNVTHRGSARADPRHTIDFRELQSGLNPNWKLVLAFSPEECKNWEFVKSFFKTKIHGYLSNGKFVRHGGAIYRDIDPYDEGHQGHPYMATRRLGYPVHVNTDPDVPIPTYPLPNIKTKIVLGHMESFKESVNDTLTDRFNREIFDDQLGYSRQVPDGYKLRLDWVRIREAEVEKQKGMTREPVFNIRRKVQKYFDGLPDSENPLKFNTQILNWGLDQRNSDEVSYLRMMIERVRKGSVEMNQAEFKLQSGYGDAMWSAWQDYTGWKIKVPLDEIAYENALAKFVARRAARSVAMKKMGLARADPDFPRMIVGKTQMKLKSTEIKDASALQTTLTMDDEYLFTLGGVGVYLLDKILENCPTYLYLHAKKSFGDTADFVNNHFRTGQFWESDLKQQEQSMRGGALQFMLRLMDHFSVPVDKIEYFKSMKLNTRVGRFVLALQTASGEIFTWLMNTIANGGRIALKYNLKKGDGLMLTGDDSLCNRFMRVSASWNYWQQFDFAEEKSLESTEEAGFASYIVKKGEIYRNPEILLRRLLVYLTIGKIKDVLMGYFLEWLTIYRLSDVLHELLTPRQMECHNLLSSIIFNAKKKLQVNVKFAWHKKVGIDVDTRNDEIYSILIENPQLVDNIEDPWDDESNMHLEEDQ